VISRCSGRGSCGGMIAGFAILAALLARSEPARVSNVDVSMFDVIYQCCRIPAATQFAATRFPVGGSMCYRALTVLQRL